MCASIRKVAPTSWILRSPGKPPFVETIEQDAEARVHLAVVLDEDPGKDLGLMRQAGHRFFYGTDEVEPLPEGTDR